MATREKKPPPAKKQNSSSPVPPKEDITPAIPENDVTDDSQPKVTPPKTSIAKKLAKNPGLKKLAPKPKIAIKLKPAIKKNVKIKQKIKALMNNPKNAETKKKLLKTCVKQVKPRKPKVKSEKEENLPPVLEPMVPIEEEDNKQKKKGTRAPKIKDLEVDPKVIKQRSQIDETIEDVIRDLSSLIKAGDIKEEESEKSDSSKPKKVVKKKNRTIENTLSKLSASERKVIDMLDLNVRKMNDLPQIKRRHSIEKFPMGPVDPDSNLSRLSIFNNIPRSISPRTKHMSKNPLSRRLNPYKTRSDSPARMLRNGKQRRLKDMGLLEGLEMTHKRRRRNCSEFSGSEMSLKMSGYESDSSFSDLSSVHGEHKDIENIKPEKKESEEFGEIKRSMSNDTETDTNSNLCNKENTTVNSQIKREDDVIEVTSVSPSIKVPEKSLILDIMKQTFNDTTKRVEEEKEKPEKLETKTTESFYSKPKEEEEKVEEVKEVKSMDLSLEEVNEVNGVEPEEPTPPVLQNGTHKEEETPENLAIKENILQALGLQSLKAANEAKMKNKERLEKSELYTGTLKTVIKINRGEKKKGRMKLTLQKKAENGVEDVKDGPSTSWKHSGQSSDTAGAHRKSHYSNRSNMDGSSEHTSDGEAPGQEGSTKALVIPEKASSFSIHPGRICKDECSYCFGKFGLFDTPCHIAQMKSVERQNKILAAEKHLTRDSCLCDACYRHVDRKANTPSYQNRSYKRSATVAPGPRQDHCHVLGCHNVATNILRRKWIIKMRRSICEVINIDLDNPGLHSIPICDDHYSALEYLMVCAICKRRLAKNHVHYLGPETVDLNTALAVEGIPLSLTDKPVVCKLCKYFSAIILKPQEERPENSSTFFNEYKKRLLHFNDIVPMDEAAAEEPIIIPTKDTKLEKEPFRKKRKLSKPQDVPEMEKFDQSRVPSSDSTSRPESPSDYMVDYNTLIPSIAMECGSDTETKKDPKPMKKLPRPETVKQAVEISKKLKNDKSSDIAVQRLGSNPSISVRQLFPCEEDLPLQGHVEFGNVKERTPEGWEKCTSVIQYDMETKHLWQELQKPYGNQSSFLRHLILLEKYFRNGDLVLAPNASHHSINYSESVHNRLRAYDNIPTSAGNVQPISMIPFNKQKTVVTTAPTAKEVPVPAPPPPPPPPAPKSTPITISQLNSPPLIPPPVTKPKPVGAPPGLISIRARPAAPLVKVQQSQKIKFPITKNWRPNLIPIDPAKKHTERKAGLVQVISGGKPYHITLEDYKKMCAIKKSFELKQKTLAANAGKLKIANPNSNSVLKPTVPRKGLVITKSTSPKNESEENIIEKLDKQVEKLDTRFSDKQPLALPKIPKSLTVIPQTVTRKPSRPSSPVLLITPKPKQIINKS